jgi:hypothetical protein
MSLVIGIPHLEAELERVFRDDRGHVEDEAERIMRPGLVAFLQLKAHRVLGPFPDREQRVPREAVTRHRVVLVADADHAARRRAHDREQQRRAALPMRRIAAPEQVAIADLPRLRLGPDQREFGVGVPALDSDGLGRPRMCVCRHGGALTKPDARSPGPRR